MGMRHCTLCQRPVEPKRVIGAGTIILAVCTGGLWLLLIPFYSKRCPICKGKALTEANSQSAIASGKPTPETHVRCPDCRELVHMEARKCKHCGCKLVPASEQ